MSRGTVAPPSGGPATPRTAGWEVVGAGPRNRALTANSRGVVPGQLTRSTLEGTPGRMRLLGLVAALAAAVFGIVGASALWSSAGALGRADENTAQVVRIQKIYADLVRADADATGAYLVGGIENPTQRADYDDSLANVAKGIAAAAEAQPADGDALGTLNTQVQTYATNVEQARVYNRQAQPVGAQYQSDASATLRSQILPTVTALVNTNQARANAEFDNSSRLVTLALVGLAAVLVLVLVMVWLARRTHRYLNPAMFVGTVVVLAALALGLITLGWVGNQVQTVRDNDFARTVAIASARSAAYDAKSNESLTLIARGSGGKYQDAWVQASNTVGSMVGQLDKKSQDALNADWTAYKSAHDAVRKLDDGGQWDAAVAATQKTDAGSVNVTFAKFDTDSKGVLDTLSASTKSGLSAPIGWVTVLGWLLLAMCVAAALLVLRGIGQRVEEYR